MKSLRRASKWLDAVVVAVVTTSLGFACVGAVDALPEPWSVVLLAAVLYGLGGALAATGLTLLCRIVQRQPSRGSAAWSGTALAMSGLLGAYLAFWVEADVLAGSKWYDTYSIVALVAVGVAVLILTALAIRLTSRAPELSGGAIALFRLTALVLVALGAWFLATDPRTGSLERTPPIGSAERPNIIVIVLDTVRADFTSVHGFSQPVTPSFERLAREGVQFLDAQSTASWTLPAVSSMLTSRLPGVTMKQGAAVRASQEPGLPEALAEMGYATVVVSNNPYVFGPFGIAAHFDTVDAGRSGWLPPSTIVERIAKRFLTPTDGALVDKAIRWLEHNDGPFFMYLHLMGGHSPYRAPRGYASPIEVLPAAEAIDFPTHEFSISEAERESLRSRYAATIRYADDQVARLLDAIDGWGLAESTLVVLTSDHGEEFGDHGGWGHGGTLFREVLHVPMVWRWPGRIPAGTRRHDVLSLVDVAPTLLAAIDPASSSRTGWVGLNLTVTQEETLPAAGASVAEIAPALRSFTNPRWKYIRDEASQREWLFDRDRDPRETTDLLRERAETAKRLRQILIDATDPAAASATSPSREPVDPHVVRQLRALGYVR